MDTETRKRLAALIAEARKSRKLSQQEVADKAEVSLGTVSNAERGASVPQAAHLRAILRVLGISEEGLPAAPAEGWAPDIRVALNVIGMWLEQVEGEERQKRIDRLVEGVLRRDL